MAKVTKQQCEAKGWNWNPKTKTCKRPKIGLVLMSVNKGSGCDNGSRFEDTKGDELSLRTQDAILKAAAKK
jgi:hypothetical protein